MFDEDDYLQLSGLQHFIFCRRQWALIHIEQQWAENYRTVDGSLMHEKAHDETSTESRGNLYIVRGLRIMSANLSVSGECDVVEFHRGSVGIPIDGKAGLWQPYPVEYKRGEPKAGSCDELQLCAQAICLEEMLCCPIPEGALFYGQTRRRQSVAFTDELREQVKSALEEMHQLYRRGHTPRVKPSKACNACSLKELCLPTLYRRKSVSSYLSQAMEENE